MGYATEIYTINEFVTCTLMCKNYTSSFYLKYLLNESTATKQQTIEPPYRR